MKKVLIVGLFFLSIHNISLAQIKVIEKKSEPCKDVGKVKALFTPIIEMKKCGEEYQVLFKDIKFQQIEEWKSFSFKDVDNAYDNLYKMIIDGFDNPPEESIMLELPHEYVWLNYTKNLGVTSFQFGVSVSKSSVIGFSPYMTRRQVDKLFGK